MANIVYPNGSKEVTVAASDKISVKSKGSFQVYQQVGYPNFPDAWSLLDDVAAGSSYTSSVFSAETVVRIDAGPAEVEYITGTLADINVNLQYQGAPATANAAGTVTAATLFAGIITVTQSTGATIAVNLTPGATLDAAGEFAVGDSFEYTLINLSAAAADTATVTAGTGHTIVGEPLVQASHSTTGEIYGTSATFRCRKTAADTFISYRV